MGLPRPDAGTPVHDYLAQHWSRMVILNWPCLGDLRTIHRALNLGVTYIDVAEIYGPFLRRAAPLGERARDRAGNAPPGRVVRSDMRASRSVPFG